MARSNYTYSIDTETNVVSIIDLGGNYTSVTNNAENVITDIVKNEGKYITDYKFVYCDTDDNWDTLIPTFKDGKCIDVKFIPGVN